MRRSCLFAAIALLCVCASVQASVTFLDGDFGSQWQLTTDITTSSEPVKDGVFAEIGVVDGGDGYGNCLRVSLQTIGNELGEPIYQSGAYARADLPTAVYDPTVSGAAGFLHFSVDVRMLSQDGTPYTARPVLFFSDTGEPLLTSTGYLPMPSVGDWQHYEWDASHPVLQQVTSAFAFGLSFSQTCPILVQDGHPVACRGGSFTMLVDNFSVTVNPVPEPTGLFALTSGLGSLGGVVLRRRK